MQGINYGVRKTCVSMCVCMFNNCIFRFIFKLNQLTRVQRRSLLFFVLFPVLIVCIRVCVCASVFV